MTAAAVKALSGPDGSSGAQRGCQRRRGARCHLVGQLVKRRGGAAVVRPAPAPHSLRAPGRWACPGRRRRTPVISPRPESGAGPRPAGLGPPRRSRRVAPSRARRRPRSTRAGKVSHSTRAPVAAPIRTAAANPVARVASPPTRITVDSPERNAWAAARTASASDRGWGRVCLRRSRFRAVSPGHIGRQDQCRHHAGGTGCDRVDGVGPDIGGAHRPAHPSRDTARQRIDIGFQWGVVLLVIGGVVADDHHHRHVGPAGVVQIGQSVAQSGARDAAAPPRVCRPSGRTRRRPRWPPPRTA